MITPWDSSLHSESPGRSSYKFVSCLATTQETVFMYSSKYVSFELEHKQRNKITIYELGRVGERRRRPVVVMNEIKLEPGLSNSIDIIHYHEMKSEILRLQK